jgi:hypothetical protein
MINYRWWEFWRESFQKPLEVLLAVQDLDTYSSLVIGKMPHHYYIGLDQTRFHQCVRENLHTRQTLGLY